MTTYATHPAALVSIDVLMEDWADGSGGDSFTYEVVPRKLEIERNDHRSADTINLELDWQALPFDPRAVRSIHVQAYLGDAGTSAELPADDDRYLAFMGFIDVPEAHLEESGETVSLRGRDYTCLFLDHHWTGGSLDITGSLGDVVQAVLDEVPGTDEMTVGYSRGAEATVLADLLGRTKFVPEAKDDAWTVLCDLCGRAGLIPVVVHDLLLILTYNDFGVDRTTFLQSDAFVPNTCAFSYGSADGNVSRLSFKRDFSEASSKQIQVLAYDDKTRTTRTGVYPPAPIVTRRKISKRGKISDIAAPAVPFYLSGSYTEAHLSAIAESIYTLQARDQVDGQIETAEMTCLDGNSVVALGNGDRVTITLGTALTTSIAGMSEAEAVSFLTARGMDVPTATAIVAGAKTAAGLARHFYVQRVIHRWSTDDGYRAEIQFCNLTSRGGA